MIFLNESIFDEDSFEDGDGILIIKNSTYVDLLMLNGEDDDGLKMKYGNKDDESDEGIDIILFLKKNGYDLDKLWSEGYNIYYGHVRGAIFEIEINLSLPS